MGKESALIVALVVTAHMAVFLAWPKHGIAPLLTHEMSVTVALAGYPQEISPPQLRSLPLINTPVVTELPEAKATGNTAEMLPAPAHAAVPAAEPITSVQDTEPDYRAAYLSNPPPRYPLSARRRGLQGKVVLNVEVLAEGVSGQVSIHVSSGHAVLDNAALQTVKTWRFISARQSGRAVTKWFQVPIQFSLKDTET